MLMPLPTLQVMIMVVIDVGLLLRQGFLLKFMHVFFPWKNKS